MAYDDPHDEIVINRSSVPIIRAGFSNIIFFLAIVASILLNQAMKDFDISLLLRTIAVMLVCLGTIRIYSCSLAKILIRDSKTLVLISPVSEILIDASKIERSKVTGIPSCLTTFILIKMRKSRFPNFYFFVAVSTNHGPYEETMIKLTAMLRELSTPSRM